MVTEYSLPTNLEAISTKDLYDIQSRIADRSWMKAPEVMHGLVTDILTNFIAFDTQTKTGTEFNSCFDFMTSLFDEFKNEVNVHEVPYPGSDRKALIIAPNEDTKYINEVINKFNNGDTSTLELNNSVIHSHLDVVPITPNSLSTLATFIDRDTGLIYARGANDTKWGAALAPLLTAMCLDNGIKPPIFVITSDEETGGDLGGLKLLQMLKGILTIDWEPLAGGPGSYATQILPTTLAKFPFTNLPSLQKLQKVESTLNRVFHENYLPNIHLEDDNLVLSAIDLNDGDREDSYREIEELLTEIGLTRKLIEDGNEPSIFTTKSLKISIEKRKKEILDRILNKDAKPLERSLHHRSWSHTSTGMGSALYGSIQTLVLLAHELNPKDITAHGPHEEGAGRHSFAEAVNINEVISILNSTFETHKELLNLPH